MNDSKFSLIDLSALSEPACKLIDAVSQCIGTLYEPTRIRRKAKAEADAVLVLAEADSERQALLKRASHRLAIQEIRRQKNIESIINKAIKSLPETVSSEPVDLDWISRFFDECKDVSNEELQKIWGQLLAGEVATSKSCSRKTLAVLKDLSPEDAELFTEFCSYVWVRLGNSFYMDDEKIMVYMEDEKIIFIEEYYFMPIDQLALDRFLERCMLTYGECLHLENLGLIHCKKDISIKIRVYDKLKYFTLDHEVSERDSYGGWGELGCFLLTQAGIELLSVAKVEPNLNYYFDCCAFLLNYNNIYLSCPLEKK